MPTLKLPPDKMDLEFFSNAQTAANFLGLNAIKVLTQGHIKNVQGNPDSQPAKEEKEHFANQIHIIALEAEFIKQAEETNSVIQEIKHIIKEFEIFLEKEAQEQKHIQRKNAAATEAAIAEMTNQSTQSNSAENSIGKEDYMQKYFEEILQKQHGVSALEWQITELCKKIREISDTKLKDSREAFYAAENERHKALENAEKLAIDAENRATDPQEKAIHAADRKILQDFREQVEEAQAKHGEKAEQEGNDRDTRYERGKRTAEEGKQALGLVPPPPPPPSPGSVTEEIKKTKEMAVDNNRKALLLDIERAGLIRSIKSSPLSDERKKDLLAELLPKDAKTVTKIKEVLKTEQDELAKIGGLKKSNELEKKHQQQIDLAQSNNKGSVNNTATVTGNTTTSIKSQTSNSGVAAVTNEAKTEAKSDKSNTNSGALSSIKQTATNLLTNVQGLFDKFTSSKADATAKLTAANTSTAAAPATTTFPTTPTPLSTTPRPPGSRDAGS